MRDKLKELLLPAALSIYGEQESTEAWEVRMDYTLVFSCYGISSRVSPSCF